VPRRFERVKMWREGGRRGEERRGEERFERVKMWREEERKKKRVGRKEVGEGGREGWREGRREGEMRGGRGRDEGRGKFRLWR
jgi:hypothetical protein